jgi:LemA protein
MTYTIILLLIGAALYAIGIYNKLVKNRAQIDEGWSGIAVQLKRRHDLIPNLVNTVKGFATHEKSVFVEVTELRNVSASASSCCWINLG